MSRALLVGSWLFLSACDAASLPMMTVDAGAGAGADAGVTPPPEVRLGVGTVRGIEGDGFQAFLGIPYAEPPVGERRWRAPEPHAAWDGVRDAISKGSACAQEGFGLGASGSEDCLFLNVHTPSPRPAAGAPVLVWIHGGGFVFGEGVQADGGTAGDVLARTEGLVVVSMNYRLGSFGFLASEALGASGNEGLQDQQLALRWVREHIAAFGGDPDRVTIAGESAGGQSVCQHLVAPDSRGLFQRAIVQSGYCDTTLPSHDTLAAAASAIVEGSGCSTAADVAGCMRALSLAEVRAAVATASDSPAWEGGSGYFGPHVDGRVLLGQFRDRVASGDVADVPVIVGWNGDEGTLFVALAEQQGEVADEARYHAQLASLAMQAGLTPEAVEAAYPLSAYPDPGAAIAAAAGDASLACPSRRAARLLVGAGRRVLVYHFEYPDAGFQIGFPRALGAFHSAEIQYVFGHPARLGRRTFTGDDAPLHDAMRGAWAGFVRSGEPSVDGVAAWPEHTLPGDAHRVFDRSVRDAEGASRAACALWE